MTDTPDDIRGTVLLCWDGSEPCRNAIRTAARILAGREAVVANVYTLHLTDLLPGADIDGRARELAEQGAQFAREVGFNATAAAIDAPTIWKGIVDYAKRHEASVVVAGTTGTTSVSTVLGSVAYGIAHHCRRPVLLIRPEE